MPKGFEILGEISKQIEEKIDRFLSEVDDYSALRDSLLAQRPFDRPVQQMVQLLKADASMLTFFGEVALPISEKEWQARSIPPPENPRAERRGRLIFGLDSSWIPPDRHLRPMYALMHAGYYLYGTGVLDRGYEYNSVAEIRVGSELITESRGLRRILSNADLFEWEMGLYSRLLEEAVERYGGRSKRRPVAIYDGSFSATYALNYSRHDQGVIARSIKSFLEKMRDLNVLPVAVYYSGSRSVVTSIIRTTMCRERPSCNACIREAGRAGREPPCTEYLPLTDSSLFKYILALDNRSPAFEVLSPLTDSFGLRLFAYYLKVDESVLRVEIPMWAGLKGVRESHLVVASQAGLSRERGGWGYPYVLVRAHENVVLRSVDREMIEELIARKLDEYGRKTYGRPLRLYRSGKARYKRGGLV